ncbi:MAG TPA: hypothetical protein VGS57_05200 [Thermoanaerobaculia bacterium]|jgi:hypothetical protein|nr:hypothetical protein [Thermoanaerobaculia bacterium]
MVSRRPLRLAACGWIALAACALRAGAQAPPAIRLLAPAADIPLVAGGETEIAWEPVDPFAALGQVEEWEAFLSLDGGATYPFRLTPHLDQDVRRFRWRVPAVPSAEARLLFRFGDEHREVAVALPQRFVVAAPAVAAPLGDEAFSLARRSPRVAGEPALPGQRGVVAWVEGSRRGTAVRHVVGSGLATFAPAQALPESPRATDLASSREAPRLATPSRAEASEEVPARRSDVSPSLPPPRPGDDLLLLTQRQNE